ncbi:MAG TPA: F0F1 ATP synthase subunit B [Chloroflexi bacterium]|nr:F0F1 ATP synthase subunit B [Chloroflexota bacterium]
MEALGFDFKLIFAYFINFAILVVALRAFAYKPILNLLEERKKKIADGLDSAEKVKEQAERERAKFQTELEKARLSSQEDASKIAQATAEMREQILTEARKEAEAIKERARAEIEAERQSAQSDLRRQVADLTVALTRKVVGQSIDKKAQHDLVGKFLAEMGE